MSDKVADMKPEGEKPQPDAPPENDGSESKPVTGATLLEALGDRKEAGEYLKLLGAEISKLEQSRTRHAYLVWLLMAAFFVASQGFGQIPLFSFEKLDRGLLLKVIPAIMAFYYYITISRTLLIRELGAIYSKLADGLYPSEWFPFAELVSPGSFMRAERFLNLKRPNEEMLGYIFLVGLIVTIAVWSPVLVFFYAYYYLLATYPLEDWILRLSAIFGIVFMTQALVVMRGNFLLARQAHGGPMRLNITPLFVRKENL